VTRPLPTSPEPWPISLFTRAANSKLGTTVLVRDRARRNSAMAASRVAGSARASARGPG
jgi:hypothetical protein